MTRFTRIAASAMLATTLGLGALAAPVATAPAEAGGQVSFTFNAQDQKQANAMKAGLGLYALANGLKSGGNIVQNGFGNMGGLNQTGSGNFGVVHQDGNGHTGTLTQNGNGNAHGLFQFGENTNSAVNQTGNGQAGATVVIGW